MGDALQDEVPDGELRRYLHQATRPVRSAIARSKTSPLKKDEERDISGLIDHPAAWGIGRQKRELARACARANGSPINVPAIACAGHS